MSTVISLSDAKARLSEVVRGIRTGGGEAIITVDGEPAVRIVPVGSDPRTLTSAETASVRALMRSLQRLQRPTTPFDATVLVGDGRR